MWEEEDYLILSKSSNDAHGMRSYEDVQID